MPEEGTQTASSTESGTTAVTFTGLDNGVQQETPAFDFTQFIEPDGTLKEGWKAGLPEEIRMELCLDAVNDSLPEAFKQLVLAQGMVGKNKVVLPTDKSTPAEIEAFQIACGRPKTADLYKFEFPPELSEYMDEGLIAAAREMAFKRGWSQKDVDAVIEFRRKEIEAGLQYEKEQDQRDLDEAERIIAELEGEATEENTHLANVLIADNCSDEDHKAKLLEVLNDHKFRPYFRKFLADIQRKFFSEHDGLPTSEGGGAMTPAMMEERAKELMATPGYMDGTMKDTNPAAWERISRDVTELFRRIEQATKKA